MMPSPTIDTHAAKRTGTMENTEECFHQLTWESCSGLSFDPEPCSGLGVSAPPSELSELLTLLLGVV